MKVAVNLLLVAGCFASVQAFAQIDEPDIEADCVKAGIYASAGKVAYSQGDMGKAREIFRNQVAWSEFCHKPQDQIATAYNNIALTYIKQGDLLKAKAWLMLAPADKKSQYNLSLIQPKLDTMPPSQSPAGLYWQYAGFGSWNLLEVKAEEAQFKIDFSGLYMGQMSLYYGPNIGEFSVVTAIKDNHAVYHETDDASAGGGECSVEMNFAPQSVNLHTLNDCGFGHNVRAEGEFVRVTP
ncbi:tetratricopeptide repeat protein [Rahnella victoriana]|uniref:Tetratricopeptide repeat protein n=1 Tax=Rahnella victoriana TaxID=1510570 RepID=A0ABS0DX20_9GAMM|nr:tetratricopeptide repeat protein [Rahnella victoriana]MBF7958394.1 tetratricopeptide repeat protein [Rahnella victoriana]